jgi:hypothetical protein
MGTQHTLRDTAATAAAGRPTTKINIACSTKAGASGAAPEGQGPAGVRSPVEIKKSKSRAGGTAGGAVHPKTTDPTSWEVELPWQPHGPGW